MKNINNIKRFGLIIIGDEILSGKRQDQHLSKAIELLRARGLQLAFVNYVGDEPARLTQTLQTAFQSGEIIFCCGGIGSTPDDHTRASAAKALNRSLESHPKAVLLIQERAQDLAKANQTQLDLNSPDHARRLNMAMFPKGARIIPNPYNKIAGFSCALSDQNETENANNWREHAAYFFPGFPVMAWPMMEWVLETHYSDWFHQKSQIEKSVLVLGAIEARLTPLMEHIENKHPNIKIFSLPTVAHEKYGAHIELGVKGEAENINAAYQDLIDGLTSLKAKWIET